MGIPLILGESPKSGTRYEIRKVDHVSLVGASLEVVKANPSNVFGR